MDNLHLVLANAYRFNEDDVLSHRVHDIDDILGRTGKASQTPPGRKGTDEYTLIRGMALHPDPIAEDRPSGERAGRINRDNPDGLSFLAKDVDHLIDDRGFAGAGRTCD